MDATTELEWDDEALDTRALESAEARAIRQRETQDAIERTRASDLGATVHSASIDTVASRGCADLPRVNESRRRVPRDAPKAMMMARGSGRGGQGDGDEDGV